MACKHLKELLRSECRGIRSFKPRHAKENDGFKSYLNLECPGILYPCCNMCTQTLKENEKEGDEQDEEMDEGDG